ncbi:hypothetical protein Desor_2227 [Desulfosporosinus orientis DSM 765]|uniref:Uncharacterized protein n=2 Tax=Desulfosporosinus orientis TaxID=1563 RepID=G7WB48_DESOD|nr:hypothetical protein Desor_2227 [Desulfosporosinus orientis DSM 765]
MLLITSDPRDEVYRDVIDKAFKYCDEFILVVRKDLSLSSQAKLVLSSLSNSLIEISEQFEWPGTMLGGGESAIVNYFKTDNHAKKILKEVSNSLHSWVQPDLPEDLSFIKGNNLWLVNTSHESESYFVTEEKEDLEEILGIRNLQIKQK